MERKTRKALLKATAAVFCLGWPAMALAETSAVNASDEGRGVRLDEVVVTARKTAENVQTIPVAVTAVTSEAISNASAQGISDIQAMAPSLQVAPAPNNAGTPLVSIRGLLSNEFAPNFDPSVGIYYDGVYAGTTIGALISNLFDVDRVEVLKGPQGTLYGRNTTGGAYNVYTKLPSDEFEGEIGGGIGNYGRREVRGMINAPFGGSAAARIVATSLKTDGYGLDATNNRKLGDQDAQMIRGAVRADLGATTQVIVRADWQKAESNGPVIKMAALRPGSNANRELARQLFGVENATTLAGALAAQAAHFAGDPYTTAFTLPTHVVNEIRGVSATLTQELGEHATLKSISAYRKSTANSKTQRSPLAQVTFNDQNNGTKQFTQEFQLNADFMDERLKLVSGLYYYKMNGFENINFYQFPRLGVPVLNYNSDARAKSYAAYAQATYAITDTVNFTGGLRYTKETKEVISRNFNGGACILPPSLLTGGVCRLDRTLKFKNTSYTASVDWRFTPDAMVYARTSRGFKSGGLPHRVTTDPQTSDPFLPEHVTDYELGLKSQFFDNRVRLNVAVYHDDYKDIQRTVLVPGFAGGPPTTSTKNAASAKIDGVELEASAAPIENLILGGTVAYTKAQYKEFFSLGVDQSNQKFQNVPKWAYSLTGAYTVPINDSMAVRGQVDWYWRSEADMFPAGGDPRPLRIQKSYGLLNGRLALQLQNRDIEIALWGKNLTDEVYFNVAFDNYATAGTINQYIAEPRTYGVDVRWKF